MPNFEFLIRKRPVSHQTKSRKNLQAWKAYVRSEAEKVWPVGRPAEEGDLRFSIVYLCDDSPADIDNIIKPIQDALVGLVYVDDSLIADVDSHRRFLAAGIDVTNLPQLLKLGVFDGDECVYVRVAESPLLESLL
ncbi:RusA family crossover junction endodeoxyribonuclease [Agrilutibacter solisilvae]|uniref:RusA family crossover junction endodeoxyribonuclease n=1 Tax=Agrilutibacter solisilvae TaxID=2763317 RepID=A0A975AS71_9GAMM|nr:RusA family crossover junction endodeoxyribonuclease [Lysobacter solisilvae]QSX77978.1 RusA family crossover junction endodeoxyribonuclease [Lysobacter solisilvae]